MKTRERSTQVIVRRGADPVCVEKLPIFSTSQRAQYAALVFLFVAANLVFWVWWLQPTHWGERALFFSMVVCLFYQATILPGVYLFFLGWMRRPRHIIAPPAVKVAMISLTVPGSESPAIVRTQLEAMLRVGYPHDSWILVDKVHSPEIEAMATSLGARYFSRHDRATWGDLVDDWNQPEAPFKAKTKAGNVNAWLDAMNRCGITYDYFTQLDIDHIPVPEYLDKVLGYFADPKIAWVQAPSVYGGFDFWTARGSAEQELVLQGPLQSGFYGFSGTPFLIGSHSTYRMTAVLEIGGFQPTRAEDHLDTVVLAAHGYEGVFLPEVIATGNGPESFETYLGQQFAWAYSMITVMLHYTPHLVRRYTFRQAIQFLFVQTWYALWSVTTLIMFLLPAIALVFDTSISHVDLLEFLAFSVPLAAIALAIWWWSRKWFHPHGILLSWRGIALQVARWPVVLSALVQVLLRREKPYMITPKGVERQEDRRISLVPGIPFMVLLAAMLGASWYFLLVTGRGEAQGYLLFTLIGAFEICRIFVIVIGEDQRRLHQQGVRLMRAIRIRASLILTVAAGILVVSVTGVISAGRIGEAVFYYERHRPAISDAGPVDLGPPLATSIGTPAMQVPPPTDALTSVAVITTPTASLPASLAPIAPPAARATSTAVPPIPVVAIPMDRRLFGVYDPESSAFADVPLDIEHDYISWDRADLIYQTIGAIRARAHIPLLTIEPWTTASGDAANVLADTAAGRNDDLIRQDAFAIRAQAPQPVIIAFAHEMDLVGNYPWSVADSDLYIRADRHYVDVFRAAGVQNVLWVWSPAGNPNALAYFPGADYVTWIGVTVLEYRAWDIRFGAEHALSFDDLFGPKYALLSSLDKPILITELGVAGDPVFQEQWMQGVSQAADSYPLLRGIIYFNAINASNAWMGDRPDFHIVPALIPRDVIAPAPPPKGR